MRGVIIVLILLAGLLAPASSAALVDQAGSASGCAPPCGPIPVIITITLDKSRNVEFDENNKFHASGKVQYYFDIDDSGYAWNPDPREEVWVTLKVAKAPNWTKTVLEPTRFKVPTRPFDEATKACVDCVRPEGDAPQMQFVYEHPLKVTIEKTRDFDAQELKRWLKSDKTYRVTINAVSNDSFAGNDQVGKPAGLQEGYGVKEVRFVAPQTLVAELAAPPPAETTPGLPMMGLVAALGAAMILVRGRR